MIECRSYMRVNVGERETEQPIKYSKQSKLNTELQTLSNKSEKYQN